MSIPIVMPGKIQAGDSLIFKRHLLEYDSSTWTLTYYLTNATDCYSFSSTPDADDFSFNVPATSTGLWAAGVYQYFGQVSNDAGEAHTVDTGVITILAPYTAPVDNRSYSKIMLDAIENLLAGKVTRDAISYSVAGRSLTKMPIKDLLLIHDRFAYEYKAECDAERIASGQPVDDDIIRLTLRSDI
ncbi:MAG: hypothetical protein ACHP6H_02100 [Legionellales bacterium]